MTHALAQRLPQQTSNTSNQQPAQQPAEQQTPSTALGGALCAMITQDSADIRKAYALRYRVFADEMGAQLDEKGFEHGLDKDAFDDVCYHLIIKDEDTDRVVGYSRIITNDVAARVGSYYSQTEFDLSNILRPGKTYMEIGRTCVDPDYRSGAVIALLWAKLGQFMMESQIDYLMGCASIPLGASDDGAQDAAAMMNYLRNKHFASADWRVTPKRPLPKVATKRDGKDLIPALLKAYLRIGCQVCGEPHWDKDFNVADVVVLLDRNNINMRYLKHFLRAA